MDFPELHDWGVSTREAAGLQKRLAERVRLKNGLPGRIRTVAGADVSYQRRGELFYAAIAVLNYPEMTLLEESVAADRVSFPYVPGLLSFRELPVLLEAFRRLRTVPDLILVDGQGIAHPRRLGLASHLGLWLDLPTIGCAKSRLCGDHAPPGPCRGDRTPLLLDGEVVGTVLTSRDRVKPLYVSPGHRIDVDTAAEMVARCALRYRMPEPTRLAHHLANRERQRSS
ncbi:MAG: deoxyribonuclease V [Syntrophotaleaceae bacterium]